MGLRRCRINIPGWDYFSELDMVFSSFEDYIDTIEGIINHEIDNAETNYHKYLIEISKIEKIPEEYPFDFSLEWKFQQKQGLRTIYYDSIVFSIYSFVERKMSYLCQTLQNNYEVKLSNFRGEGIRKYREYLSKVVGVNFESIEDDWDSLMKFAHLRNFLIHSETGKVISEETKNGKVIVDLLCRYKDIRVVKQEAEYVFEFEGKEILKDFLRVVRIILNEVYYEGVRES